MRELTPDYFVAPQIQPSDVATIAEAGIKCVICNRPDGENAQGMQAPDFRTLVEEAGMTFVDNPFDNTTFTQDTVTRQGEAIAAATGPVLAYCRSGMRSSIVWAYCNGATLSPDEILNAAATAGYQLDHMRPMLTQMYNG